jgi:hypothetical protein
MAAGGYKCVSFSWSGGRTDTPLERCKYILYNFCKAIVDANVGWSWNDDYHPDGLISEYKTMGGHTDSSPNIAFSLANWGEDHDYILVIGLNYQSLTSLRSQDCVTFGPNNTNYNFYGSLYLGYFKDCPITWDSTNGFHENADPTDNPDAQWLKWMHFAMSTTSSYNKSFASGNVSNHLYTYYALLKDTQIGIFVKDNAWSTSNTNNMKGFVAGELFSTTAHSSDLHKLGCVYFNGLSSVAEADSLSGYNILANSVRTTGLGVEFFQEGTYAVNCGNCSQIFKADGTMLSGVTAGTNERVQLRYDPYQAYNWCCNTVLSPGGRWTPCYVYYATQDQTANGIVSGDSFKGFIDTDLMRGVNPQTPLGQVLGANGEFIHIGGGFAIGWDPNNTVSFF